MYWPEKMTCRGCGDVATEVWFDKPYCRKCWEEIMAVEEEYQKAPDESRETVEWNW